MSMLKPYTTLGAGILLGMFVVPRIMSAVKR